MLFNDTYKTITNISEGIYKEKGSKFLSFAYPVKSENEVKIILTNLRKEYYDARHHCYAYVLGFDKSAWRINDDGEPSGTAGRPIYGQILSYDLTNLLIVVIRYFGGTKLGVSGLINAYKTSAYDAIINNVIQTKVVLDVYKLTFNYEMMNNVMKIIKDENLSSFEHNFEETCNLLFSVRKNDSSHIVNKFNKIDRLKIEYIRTE